MSLRYSQSTFADTVDDLAAIPAVVGQVVYVNGMPYKYTGTTWSPMNNVSMFDGGVPLNGSPSTGDIVIWVDSVTTNTGTATFYLTADRTANGRAIFSNVNKNSINASYVDGTNMYAKSDATISSDLKTITIPITKQTMNIVQVAGINVVGSLTMPSAGSGVVVKLFVFGIAA